MKSMTKEVVKRPLVELLEELKSKIVLLEGDRRAYYESSYIAMQQNREKIATLRKELHDLRTCLWNKTHSDLTIVSQAFQSRPVEKSAFSNKSSRNAIDEMDFRVSDSMKRFNLVKFATQRKRKRVETLVAEYRCCEIALETVDEGNLEARRCAQHIRDMENRYDKLVLKHNECEFIQQTYSQIFDRLYDEAAYANSVLDELECDIRRCRAENTDLILIYRDASEGKEVAMEELRRLEEFVYADRKRRDIEVLRMRKVSEENRLENERNEKKVSDEQNEEAQNYSPDVDNTVSFSESSEPIYSAFEDNYQRLKYITGIPNVSGMVDKFESQMRTKHDLVTVINTMEANINARRKVRTDQQGKLDYLKMRVDRSAEQVNVESRRRNSDVLRKSSQVDKISEDLQHVSEFVSAAKFGVEHLMEKMIHVKVKDKPLDLHEAKPTTAEEYVLRLFNRVNLKIRQLIHELHSHDVNDFLAKLATERNLLLAPQMELEGALKKQVPGFNVRVAFNIYNDAAEEEESGDDSLEWKSREVMKAVSAEFIEAKTRKNKNRRKKKGEQKK